MSEGGSRMSRLTQHLANSYCGGSSRKLIASWWYAILGLSGLLMLLSLVVTSTRMASEGFASFWSALMLIVLSIGGTMIMRKFHNSFAVGFFMGSVVAMSQLFFLLFLVYSGYARDRKYGEQGFAEEMVMALLSLVQCILLGSFAAILGAHRSDMMDKSDDFSSKPPLGEYEESETQYTNSEYTQSEFTDYEPPRVSQA